jgi:hypothetical protein
MRNVTSTNPYEVRRRFTKAEAFTSFLIRAGIPIAQVECADDRAWELLAELWTQRAREVDPKARRFHPPSEECKAEVLRMMHMRSAEADPFSGLRFDGYGPDNNVRLRAIEGGRA